MTWSVPTSLEFELLSDPDRLVRLQAEPPLRMAQAVIDGARGVLDHVRPVHRLQRETLEGKTLEILRACALLRIDQLQLVAFAEHEVRAGLGADANPVHAIGRIDRAVGLDADRETARMQRIDQRRIDLQQRLATGQHRIAVRARPCPLGGDRIGKLIGGGVAPAQRAIGSDEIGVAEPADRAVAIRLAAAPQVAAGKPAEHGRSSGMGAFALQGQKDLLHRIVHQELLTPEEAGRVCRSASPTAMAAAIATFNERKPGLIGIFSRASATAATASGTPAVSRPNSRMSDAP